MEDNTYPQTAPEQPNVVIPPNKNRFKNKKVLLICAVLLLAAVGAVAAKLLIDSSNSDQPSTTSVAPAGGAMSVFCIDLGGTSLQCENLSTKEIRKYVLPEPLKEISGLESNLAGDKFLVSAWTLSSPTKYQSSIKIYDSSFTVAATLPITYDADGVGDISEVKWLNNETVMYVKSRAVGATDTTLYAYNVKTNKETVLIKVNGMVDHFMPTGNNNYMYALQSWVEASTNVTRRKLVVLDLQKNTSKDVRAPGLNTEGSFAYDAATAKFYESALRSGQQKFDINIYSMTNLSGTPSLQKLPQIKDVTAYTPTAYKVITTEYGVLGTGDSMSLTYPMRFYTETGKYTRSSLAVGSATGQVLFALSKFPNLTRASENKAVVSDFFVPQAGTPRKITAFLEKLVTDAPDCKPNEYLTLTIDKYDQDKQFSVQEAGCGRDHLAFYIADGATYKQVAATQEGMSCEERDRLGITAVVLSECQESSDSY
jgi:hypothetical protein